MRAALSRNRRSCSYLFDQVFISFFAHVIAAAWCEKHDVPIEKIFSKALLMKAVTVPLAHGNRLDWKFYIVADDGFTRRRRRNRTIMILIHESVFPLPTRGWCDF